MLGFVSQSFKAGKRPVTVVSNPDVLPNLQVWYNADLSNTTNFNVAPTDG